MNIIYNLVGLFLSFIGFICVCKSKIDYPDYGGTGFNVVDKFINEIKER